MRKLLVERLTHTLLILRSFRGNARGCLITEPLWGIPYNLYIAYASLYMRALGLSPQQIGIVAAAGLASEMVFSFAGGMVTDKLGRKRTTLIFDLIGWSIPTLIWAFAAGYEYFLIAAMVNGIFRVTAISWSCLLIEDTAPRKRVHVYAWITVASALAGFFAPLAGYVVDRAGLIPAARGLYLFAFVSMTAMFLIRNRLVHETAVGYRKMAQAKIGKFREVVSDYKAILSVLRHNSVLIVAFLVVMLGNIQLFYGRYFLSLLLKEGIQFQIALVSLAPALASISRMTVIIFVLPGMSRMKPAKAISWGFMISAVGVTVLASAPVGAVAVALVGAVLEAAGFAIIAPFAESMLANAIADEQRAKTVSLFQTLLNGMSSPFGYLGGLLAGISPRYPFLLVLGTLVLRFLLIRLRRSRPDARPRAKIGLH